MEADATPVEGAWPAVPGEFLVLDETFQAPVALSTLASTELPDEVAALRPPGLSIVGKTETENIGVEKVVLNVIANPAICFLVVAGADPQGHRSGATLLSLLENGVDDDMRVVGSPGRRPVLRNLTPETVDEFRRHVRPIDMVGCKDAGEIAGKIREIFSMAREHGHSCGLPRDRHKAQAPAPVTRASVPIIEAGEAREPRLDKEGYFVVLPQLRSGRIIVEHYSNDNHLIHVIEGDDARNIYLAVIENRLVSRMDHAAYLGKELEKAELSMKHGFRYVQDGA